MNRVREADDSRALASGSAVVLVLAIIAGGIAWLVLPARNAPVAKGRGDSMCAADARRRSARPAKAISTSPSDELRHRDAAQHGRRARAR